jgi:uncharacterized protein YjbJ (UPF0337 family)
MADNAFQEKWDQIRTWVKKNWGDRVTDDDLDRVAGQREQLCGLLNERCGVSRETSNRQIDNIIGETNIPPAV